MGVLLIGDIGWEKTYHLGDEAMTEAAISQLAGRGMADARLISAKPEVATSFYGLGAVGRPGFRKAMTRSQKLARLRDITSALAGSGKVPSGVGDVIDAVRDCSAVLIAGGGNMNSKSVHYLFDRLALTRMAKHFEKPLIVSSQTVGPILTEEDVPLIREIADYSEMFGARETTTYELVRGIASDPSKVFLTMDDAFLLDPAGASSASDSDPSVDRGRYVVGSFTDNSGTTGLSTADYHRELAASLDEVADVFDAEVFLIPHMGGRDGHGPKNDEVTHDSIASLSTSGRVHVVGMMTARESLSFMNGAILSVSTRYHPLVLGPSLGVPSIGIFTSYYSSVRMRGALDNLGLGRLAVPSDFWLSSRFPEFLRAVRDNYSDILNIVHRVREIRLREQHCWWDSVVSVLKSESRSSFEGLSCVDNWSLDAPYLCDLIDVSTRLSDQIGLERQLNAINKANRLPERGNRGLMLSVSRELDELSRRVKKLSEDIQG